MRRTALEISLRVDAIPGLGTCARDATCGVSLGAFSGDLTFGVICTGASAEGAAFSIAFGVWIRAHTLSRVCAGRIGAVTIL
jgi:hypothetical protein